MFRIARPYRIEWQDCDPAGIVYFPRYFAIFDTSTTTLFEKALGMKKRDFIKHYGFAGYPMVDARATFHIPGVFGDDVEIHTAITKLGKSSISIEHHLMKDGELAVQGWEKRVWVGQDPANPDRLKSTPLPPDVVEKLSK